MPVSTISLGPDERILNDPECSIETLLKVKANDA